MVTQLPGLDRLPGVGLAALDRLSLAPSQGYAPQTAFAGQRPLRPGLQTDGRRGTSAGSQPRDFRSFAALQAPFGENLGTDPSRQLGTQASTLGRTITDPTGGVNQPGLAGLMGAGNTTGTNPAGVGNIGGDWGQVDQWNGAINAAASKWGVDPARLKAHMRIESGGNPNAVQHNPTYGDTYGLMQINPAYWDATLKANGINMYTPEGNIEGAAFILADNYKRYGDWDKASSAFFVGNPDWLGADTVNGTTGQTYQQTLNTYIQQAGGGLTANQQFRNAYQSPQGAQTANSVLNAAKQYVGVSYVWGSIPNKGQNPWDTGWDCSGFTRWLDQTYGTGQLPAGSHYQYAWAQQNGNLHGANALQPGDLIFFDTGSRSGGGANLNGASHVGVYLGGGQFLHAANPSVGTIVSDLNQYMQMYPFLGGATMAWSGGGSPASPYGSGVSPANAALRQAYTGYGRGYESTLNKFSF